MGDPMFCIEKHPLSIVFYILIILILLPVVCRLPADRLPAPEEWLDAA